MPTAFALSDDIFRPFGADVVGLDRGNLDPPPTVEDFIDDIPSLNWRDIQAAADFVEDIIQQAPELPSCPAGPAVFPSTSETCWYINTWHFFENGHTRPFEFGTYVEFCGRWRRSFSDMLPLVHVTVPVGARRQSPQTATFEQNAWCNAELRQHGWSWTGRFVRCSETFGDGRWRPERHPETNEILTWDCAHCALCYAPTNSSIRVLSISPHTFPRAWMTIAEINNVPPNSDTSTVKNYAPDNLPYSCSSCGLLGHNTRTCTSTEKVYDKVGIEIEGRWTDIRAVRGRAEDWGMTGEGDGSLACSPDSDAQPYEFQTAPGTVREALQQLLNFYPDETDHTCGMHVHVSFPSMMDVSLLATEKFFSYFKARWQQWGNRENIAPMSEFWSRLNDENDYCRVNEAIDGDITHIDRYHQLNFSSWRQYRTVECRLLPMFVNSKLAVSAVSELMSIYHDYLSTVGLIEDKEAVVELMEPVPIVKSIELEVPQEETAPPRVLEIEWEDPPPPSPGMRRLALTGDQDYLPIRELWRLAA